MKHRLVRLTGDGTIRVSSFVGSLPADFDHDEAVRQTADSDHGWSGWLINDDNGWKDFDLLSSLIDAALEVANDLAPDSEVANHLSEAFHSNEWAKGFTQ